MEVCKKWGMTVLHYKILFDMFFLMNRLREAGAWYDTYEKRQKEYNYKELDLIKCINLIHIESV